MLGSAQEISASKISLRAFSERSALRHNVVRRKSAADAIRILPDVAGRAPCSGRFRPKAVHIVCID
jgi:hypothetical protein